MTRYFASAELAELIGEKREATSAFLQETLQRECEKKEVGVKILSCQLLEAHPPAYVALDFENVISALEAKETKIMAAETYEAKVKKQVEASVEEILLKAKVRQLEKVQLTAAKAKMFDDTLKAYKESPEIFLLRQYLRTLEENMKNRRLIISNVKNTKSQVDSLNLEDSGMKIVDYKIPVEKEENDNGIEGN